MINKFTKSAFKSLLSLSVYVSFISLHAQSLEERLSMPIVNCETIAVNSQNIISTFDSLQKDSILAILKIWEIRCNENEPIQRVKILLAIQDESFEAKNFTTYFEKKVNAYKYRISSAERNDYFEYYERNKASFFYVKLRGVFDEWTEKVATRLLKSQFPGTDEYLICMLFANQFDELREEVGSKMYEKSTIKTKVSEATFNYNSNNATYAGRGGFAVMLGVWQPIGKMAKNFTISPQFGFGLSLPFGAKYRVDGKFLFTKWVNKKTLLFNVDNETQAINSYFGLMAGMLFSREFKMTQKMFFDINAGLNFAIIDPEIKSDDEGDEDESYSIETFDIEVGVRFTKRMGQYQNIALNIALHYVPYNLDYRLISDVGTFYVNYSLIFKF